MVVTLSTLRSVAMITRVLRPVQSNHRADLTLFIPAAFEE